MEKIAIIDYGMGNIDSVVRAVEECGGVPVVINNCDDIRSAGKIIMPGVGAFSDAMKNLRAAGLEEVLTELVVERRVPFLGICLGMQVLVEKGFEGGETMGLGWIKGEVGRLVPDQPNVRIPHIGWNEVFADDNANLFKSIDAGTDFYFVHSYHMICQNKEDILASTPYCGGFVSAVGKENIYGVQFHPEKSQRAGLQIIRNFLSIRSA